MLCEECQKNEAAFSVTITSGGETTTRHLCGECMQKMELSLTGGDISGFLSSILSILSQSAEENDDSPVCSGCGMHYSAFERTGRLGCAQCYHDFADQLRPVLQRIHGNIQHEGRKPARFEEAPAQPQFSPLEQKREEIRLKMEEAVACENFEDAAKYRDELRALAGQEAANVSPAPETQEETPSSDSSSDEKGEISL